MPGVLIIESLAQAAAILQFKSSDVIADDSYAYYFVGIDNARFRAPVTPGDQLMLNVKLIRFMRGIWKFSAEARVGETLVAEAELMCTVRTLK
jgi:3-hydroxyacyl-[acyl-carrier-protein] dehydratase